MKTPEQHSYNPAPIYQYWIHTPQSNTPIILLPYINTEYRHPRATLLQSCSHISILNTDTPEQHSYNPAPIYQYWIQTPQSNTPTILLPYINTEYRHPRATLLQSCSHISILNTYTPEQHSYNPAPIYQYWIHTPQSNTPKILLPYINTEYIHPRATLLQSCSHISILNTDTPEQHSYNPAPIYQYWIHTPQSNTPTILLPYINTEYIHPKATLLQSCSHISILNTDTPEQHSYNPAPIYQY